MAATRHSFGGSPQHFNGNLGQEDQQGVMGQMKSAVSAVPDHARHAVEEYPLSTVLAVFGVGIGVGVCVGMSMFSNQSSSSWSSSNWMPSSSSSWFPSMNAHNSSWFPSMSSHGSSWMPSSLNSSCSSNWSDSLMRGAKNMFGQ